MMDVKHVKNIMAKSSDYALSQIDKENKKLDFLFREYEREIEKIKREQQPIINNVSNLLGELNYGSNNK